MGGNDDAGGRAAAGPDPHPNLNGRYTPAERRALEAALRNGSLRGVACTNALELGIDLGRLDCTLHLGFPGTIASLWQQAGRAGRREQMALSIMVAFDSPLDQYFIADPARLLGAKVCEPHLSDINCSRNRACLHPLNPNAGGGCCRCWGRFA